MRLVLRCVMAKDWWRGLGGFMLWLELLLWPVLQRPPVIAC